MFFSLEIVIFYKVLFMLTFNGSIILKNKNAHLTNFF